ncbi:MAG: UvrD-helicase domain-containing protein [Succinivibrionaceae bacterium]|nr:UvrD-helicase domain-containing protein [Succinivibrionaceae bacterium]
MERDYLLRSLNPAQREVVSAPRGNMIIVAGAGTGKTRVLVSRVSWLLQVEGVPARSILAVTFTNKAAQEMRLRIGALAGEGALRALWCSTFHSVCVRLLFAYATQAGLRPNFTIIDTDDGKGIVKAILRDLREQGGQGFSTAAIEQLKPQDALHAISKAKSQRQRAADCAATWGRDERSRLAARVYREYERRCEEQNLVDFDELLLRTVELLERNEAVRDLQHHRFQEILVDEFQDTSALQYDFLRLMAGPGAHVSVVGDDDQSIYTWRGADYTNMRRFMADFPAVSQHKLDENYRSTQNILDVANALIKGNTERLMEKVLHGTQGEGSPVSVLSNYTAQAEGINVARIIAGRHQKGEPYGSFCILYRLNHLSLALEQQLSAAGIPYQIYGGLKFFEREEIKNALAYLQLALNPADNVALLRIINVPSRKIGPAVVAQLYQVAEERGCSLMDAIDALIEYAGASPDAPDAVRKLARRCSAFKALVDRLRGLAAGEDLLAMLDCAIDESGLHDYYRQKDEKDRKGMGDNLRAANLDELRGHAGRFVAEQSALGEAPTLADFLATTSLQSGTEMAENGAVDTDTSKVQMMTIHAAKGLEFPSVILAGCERTILPHVRFGMGLSPRDEEEERRLAYVAVTRAQQRLIISYAQARVLYGKTVTTGKSPFLLEVERALGGSGHLPYRYL